VYQYSQGSVSLEEAFFGPPKRKAGGYARREAAKMRRLSWGFGLSVLMRRGHSKTRAAEILSEESGGRYEPETIKRMAHKLPKSRSPRRKIK